MKMKRIIIYMLLAFACCFVKAQEKEPQLLQQEIRSLLTKLQAGEKFNGVVLLAKGDEILYEEALGYARKDPYEKLDLNSVFGLASISKVITSTAVLQNVEAGKLSLEDGIREYFPDLPEAYEPVTIKYLLTHTAGVPDYLAKGPVFEVGNQEIFAYAKRLNELDFTPGTAYKYSNTSFVLLAMLVEKVSGMSFPKYVDKKIFKPAGMKSSCVGQNLKDKKRVSSYHISGNIDDKPLDIYGPGGIYSTAADLYRFDRAWFGGKLLSAETMQQVIIPNLLTDGTKTSYGLGWGVYDMGSEVLLGHTGGMFGFRTMYEHQKNSELILIMLTNIGDKCQTMEVRTAIFQAAMRGMN